MHKVSFLLETITPLFMSGADGKTLELRPSAFKGMMRFWWRAVRAESNIENLWKEEAKIFGAADEKFGRSKIKITLNPQQVKESKYKPLPHHTGDSSCKFLPSCGSRSNPKRCSKGFRLSCINPGTTFDIILESWKNIELYKNTFIISTILGGLGKRSRRGFGSIKIIKINKETLDFSYSLESILQLLMSFNNLNFELRNQIIINKNSGGDYPWIKTIRLGKEENNFEKLLKKIGEATHNFKNPALGFSDRQGRLASPVFVSMIKTSENKYRPIITTLNTVCHQSIAVKKQNDFIGALL